MRKGYTLIELLTAFIIILAISLMCAGPTRSILGTMLQSQKDVQENITVGHMLGILRDDIEQGSKVTATNTGVSKIKDLLIESEDKSISYRIADEKIIRTVLSGDSDSTQEWPLLRANINWAVWNNANGNALEITTSIDRGSDGKVHKRLKNSHVFFAKGKRIL